MLTPEQFAEHLYRSWCETWAWAQALPLHAEDCSVINGKRCRCTCGYIDSLSSFVGDDAAGK
jgi:hypothetical protein